jgi:hypothetical protein
MNSLMENAHPRDFAMEERGEKNPAEAGRVNRGWAYGMGYEPLRL